MNEEKIHQELKQLRIYISKVVGTQDLPKKEQFSKEAIKKAAAEFRKLKIERGEWIPEHEINKVIRSVKHQHQAGRFIIEKFQFKNYFIRGWQYYFNRKDLLALNKELKARKIHISTYMELEEDKEKFQKYVQDLKIGKKRRPKYKIPKELENIFTEPYNHPPKERIDAHIKVLLEEYERCKLVQYVDIFPSRTYAIFKRQYHFDRYLDKGIMKQCKKWCFEFNYANKALREIKKIRSQVIY